MPYKLIPKFQEYPWGDLNFIQSFLSMPDKIGIPLAEMWLGAHPRSSSDILCEGSTIPLYEAIADDPELHLGQALKLYEGRLPFLFKVLAAAKPLSIQMHPDKQTAMAGFATENAKGIALSDPRRTYKDNNHKPELICALSPFKMLCGFRAYAEIIEILSSLSMGNTFISAGEFIRNPQRQSLKQLYHEVMNLDPLQIKQISETKLFGSEPANPWLQDVIVTCKALQHYFPNDVGILAPLFLNIITLKPGEALFLKAGLLHSYIQGAGLELMANSDNVIRGGLTSKYIDLDALFAIADFSEHRAHIISPRPVQGVTSYPSPIPELQLQVIKCEGEMKLPYTHSPRIILVLEGTAMIPGLEKLSRGEAVYYPASDASIIIGGKAIVAVAGIGNPDL